MSITLSSSTPRIAPPATVLRGPADADHFRTQVGRYGDRWYCDPLPACEIADITDMVWPSVSTVKKASGSDWSFVALKRAAQLLEDRPDALTGLDFDARYEMLKSANKLGLSAAAQRGTNVHLMAEARLYGQTDPVADGAPGSEYRRAVQAFFDDWQPTLVAAEFVTVNRFLNGYGYGGTSDALVRIDGKVYLLDWKSRGEDSNHGAYPEEAAQIAAYACADYMIVDGPDGARRQPLPAIDGGLIVSIKPDGYRVYPVDLDVAFGHWESLHAWWVARRDERAAIGRQWAVRKATTPAPAAAPNVTPPPFDAAPAPLPATRVEQLAVVPERTPDEGGPAHTLEVDTWRESYERARDTNPAVGEWFSTLARQAQQHGVSFHMSGAEAKTDRRIAILAGLVRLAKADSADDETLRALLALTVGADWPLFANVPAGRALGLLDAAEAGRFADLALAFTEGRLIASVDDGDVLRFAPAA